MNRLIINSPLRKRVISLIAICGVAGISLSNHSLGAEDAASNQPRPDIRATTLIGAGIRSSNDEDLGQVDDLLIDIGTKKIVYVIVEYGGVLSVGSKLFPFPLQSFNGSSATNTFVLGIDKKKMESAPGFSRNAVTDWSKYESTLDRYFGVNKPASTVASRNLHLVKGIIGAHNNVLDKTGARVGNVLDMVISRNDGKIQYLVLKLDKAQDDERRLLPLPLQAFYFGRSGGPPVLDIPVERLNKTYTFPETRWPAINDIAYQAAIGRYLGLVTQNNPSPAPPNADVAPVGKKAQ